MLYHGTLYPGIPRWDQNYGNYHELCSLIRASWLSDALQTRNEQEGRNLPSVVSKRSGRQDKALRLEKLFILVVLLSKVAS